MAPDAHGSKRAQCGEPGGRSAAEAIANVANTDCQTLSMTLVHCRWGRCSRSSRTNLASRPHVTPHATASTLSYAEIVLPRDSEA